MLKETLHPDARQRRWVWGRWATALILIGLWPGMAADDLAREKSGYNLFNPTPPDLMRPLSTDRPDQTESPFTVDAGHFQLEMDMVNALFDHDLSGQNDTKTQIFAVAPVNLKLGLLNNLDVQFVVDAYVHERIEDDATGTTSTKSGMGNFVTRLKFNFWGNDDGTTAMAVMPFVKWPLPESSFRNGRTEGGIIFPFAVELSHGWGLGVMTEFDFVASDSSDYDVEYFNTITVGHDLIGPLASYVEFAALVAPESDTDWLGQVAWGFTYALNDNTQLDWGCNFGVTEPAPDFNPFMGLSWRF